jgi:hypothetical protein
MESKQKGDNYPGSHAVGDRNVDKRVEAMQESRGADYMSFQTTSGGSEKLSERNANEANFDVCLVLFLFLFLLFSLSFSFS